MIKAVDKRGENVVSLNEVRIDIFKRRKMREWEK